MDALHGEAWKVCQDLMTNEDLKKPDGYKLILKELAQIEKVGVVRKTESFEAYFERLPPAGAALGRPEGLVGRA